MEQWKEVPGFDDVLVSNFGNVKVDGKEKPLRRELGKSYMRVSIHGKRFRVHELVALAFYGTPPQKGMTANHLGKNSRDDNSLVNISGWLTPKQQSREAYETGKLKKPSQEGRPVEAINVMTGERKRYQSIWAAAKDIGCKDSEICHHLNGERKTCHGYRFKYLEGDRMENKQAILDALKQALNLTRAGDDITALNYDKEREEVQVHFNNSNFAARRINVAADSGIAMIRDVMRGLEIG